MAHKENSGQGTGSGVTVTTADATSGDAWQTATAGTGGTLQWDNTHATPRSVRAIKNATGGTSTLAYTAWTGLSYATMNARSYLYLTGTPAVTVMVQRGLASGSQKFRVTVESDGKLRLRDSANNQLAASTNNVATGQFVRVEVKAVAGASAAWTLKYWTSADSSGTPTESFSGSTGNFAAGNFDEIRFATSSTFANVGAFWGADFGIDDTAALGTAGLSPTGIAVPVALGSLSLAGPGLAVAPSGIAVPVNLGALSLSDSALAITPTGLAIAVSLGTPTLSQTFSIAPSGLAVPAALGTPTLANAGLAVAPAGIAVGAALGSPALTDGAMTVAPTGIPVGASLGTPAVTDGSLAAAPAGVAVPIALGSPTVAQAMAIIPTGIAVAAALGAPALADSAMAVTPTGIAMPADLGVPTVDNPMAVAPDGIAVAAGLGTPAVAQGLTVTPDGIAITVHLGDMAVSEPVRTPARGGTRVVSTTASIRTARTSTSQLTERTGVSLR